MNHNEEQNFLFKNYLNSHVFSYWNSTCSKNESPSLNLILQDNVRCKYCSDFSNINYSPESSAENSTVVKNCNELVGWIEKNNLHIRHVNVILDDKYDKVFLEDLLKIVLHKLPESAILTLVIDINSNINKSNLKELIGLADNYKLNLEFIIDYNVLFDNASNELHKAIFNKDNKSNLILPWDKTDIWCKIFDTYINNICKYNELSYRDALCTARLVNARSVIWNKESLLNLRHFVNYVIDRSYDEFNNTADFFDFLNENCISIINLIHKYDLGTYCDLQNSFSVRLRDLKLLNCSNITRAGYSACDLMFNKDNDIDCKLENPYLYMFSHSFNSMSGNRCCDCPINTLCNGYCLSTNFNINRDFFTPVDTICNIEYYRVFSVCKSLHSKGILESYIKHVENLHPQIAQQISWIKDNILNAEDSNEL